jgi:hypothetical protein
MLAPPPTLRLDEWTWTTAARDGTPITVRPLRRDDEQREIAFISSLSERSRYFRMFTPLRFLSPQLLSQFMDVDYDRRMALVATVGSGDEETFVGVARYVVTDRPDRAELGVTVTDAWHRRGICDDSDSRAHALRSESWVSGAWRRCAAGQSCNDPVGTQPRIHHHLGCHGSRHENLS